MIRVKICGITNRDDADAAVAAGASMLGFNFYRGSRRYVPPQTVREIIKVLPDEITTVGVFVNASRDEIQSVVDLTAISALQFHGDEPPELCDGWHCPVIKAIRIRDEQSVAAAQAYETDFILADAFVEGEYGGTGERVAVELLQGLERRRLILAGGLTPENVVEILRAIRPYAVDVATGVESAPGRKDRDRMRRFIGNAHAA